MKIAFYSTKPYDRIYFEPKSQEYDMQLHFYETGCNEETIPLAKGHDAICIFVNDHLNENMIRQLKEMGIKAILLRCAGYNNVDVQAAHACGIPGTESTKLFSGGSGRVCSSIASDSKSVYT